MRSRNVALERELTALAAEAAGYVMPDPDNPMRLIGDDRGLSRFSNSRCAPGPVYERDFDLELKEELADGRNYALWGIQQVYDAYLAGDPDAADMYERRMRALTHLVRAWCELHTNAA